MVRIQSGTRSIRNADQAEDEFFDKEGNLFRRYPIEDDPHLVGGLTTNPNRRRQAQARDEAIGQGPSRRAGIVRRPRPNRGKTKCSKCGRLGHNKRTCNAGSENEATDLESKVEPAEESQLLTIGAPPAGAPSSSDSEESNEEENEPVDSIEVSEPEDLPAAWDLERDMQYYIDIANEVANEMH